MNRRLDLLLLFYFVTSFGSILGMIATFLAAESTFGSLHHLATALSLRTVVSMISSWNSPRIFRKFGIKKVLYISECLGLIALAVLVEGMRTKNFPMAVGALSLLAIPSNLLSQGIIGLVKLECGDDRRLFSDHSSRINKVMGIMDVLIGLTAPLILTLFSIEMVYAIDLLSYLLGFGILLSVRNLNHEKKTKTTVSAQRLPRAISSVSLQTLSSLFPTIILIGLVPLIAGSGDIVTLFGNTLPSSWFISALWSTEGVGLFISGFIYGNPALIKKLNPFLQSGILFVFLSVVLASYLLLIVGCIWVTVSYDILFKSKRDEALMNSGDDQEKVLGVASSFALIKSFFCTVSPLVIVSLMNRAGIGEAILVLFIFQITIYSYPFLSTLSVPVINLKKKRVTA